MNTSITHTRQILLAQNDRSLDDAGISRRLLERGDRAWPWRETAQASGSAAADSASALADSVSERARRERLARAARELDSLDDRELADLGIGRGDIARAARFGRPGVEYPDSDHVDEAASRHAA